jgi:hypothetical protein
MSKDLTTLTFKPIVRRSYTLDEVAQEILCETLLEGPTLGLDRLRSFVKAQTRSPGVIADDLTHAFATFLINEGVLSKNPTGDGWMIEK